MTLIADIVHALHAYAVCILPAFVAFWLARNYFHHGLYRFPGPFWAHLTNLWRFVDVYGRDRK